MKQMNLWQKIMLLGLLLTQVFMLTPVYAGGNDWVNGWLRADTFDIYNNTDYKVQLYAGALPSTLLGRNFTTGWLAVSTCASLAPACFMQVGLLAQNDGVHWFVEMFDTTNGGVDCSLRLPQGAQVYWYDTATNTIPLGCRGAVGDLVQQGQWATVELVKYTSLNYWIARVNGNDVAHIKINVNRIYKGFASMEEGYNDPIDPQMTGQFWFQDPQYNYGGWKSWMQSAASTDQHNYITLEKQVNFGIEVDPNPECPTYYGATTNLNSDLWYWYAGTGGVRCGWLFPPLTIDDFYSGLTYTGSWSHVTGLANTWNNSLSWGYNPGDKVALTTPTTNSISRVYSMASNRGTSVLKVNGSNVFTGNDNTADTRRQVVRTAPAAGSTTVEVSDSCCGLVDLDALVVDIPRVPSGTYDDRSYMFNYIGSWTYTPNVTGGAYSNTEAWNQNTGDAATFTFTGNNVTYYYSAASNRGIAAVTIDGVNQGTIDQWSASTTRQVSRTWYNLGSGVHTIHISNTGNTSHTGHFIAIDDIVVS